jgi:hypothetical protein
VQGSSLEQKNGTQDQQDSAMQDDMPSFDEWKQKEQAKTKTQEGEWLPGSKSVKNDISIIQCSFKLSKFGFKDVLSFFE